MKHIAYIFHFVCLFSSLPNKFSLFLFNYDSYNIKIFLIIRGPYPDSPEMLLRVTSNAYVRVDWKPCIDGII